MAIDFEQIARDNIREYGEGTRHLELLGGLYSDQTHFIYELLQNAEDAGATRVEYHLHEDRLELRHDGRYFTEADVRGICGVGDGTKNDDITAIGRFGVGFKSVYAFTDSPTIHSDEAHFKIELFVRPSAVPPIAVAQGWTHIVLPFDKKNGPQPEECAEDIRRGLNELDDHSLLFLSSVRKIRFRDHVNDDDASQERSEALEDGLRTVSIDLQWTEDHEAHDWIVWSRDLGDIGIKGRAVEFAIRVTSPGDDGRREPVRLDEPPLVVFFPTEKETHLGFLLQGPFRTTPARDNVPPRDETNRAIVGEAALLLIDMLIDLRDRSLLTAAALSSLPLEPAHFVGSMLEPLHLAIVFAFHEHPLIPSENGVDFLRVEEAALARTEGLRALLDVEQLSSLLGKEASWASGKLESGFRRFLTEILGVPSLTPERVVPAMDEAFLVAQSDEWIGRLYDFLNSVRALSRSTWSSPAPALQQPLLRLSDGSHQLPLDDERQPSAWLPSERPSRLPQVAPGTLEPEGALEYLKFLGLREPDLIGELCEFTLPRYAGLRLEELDESGHLDDVAAVVEALAAEGPGRNRLRTLLAETAFLVGLSATTGKRMLRRPSELFIEDATTTLLLGDQAATWFVDAELYSAHLASLDKLGVRTTIVPAFRQADQWGIVRVISRHGWHERGIDRFDPDATCDLIAHAVADPTFERSLWIWTSIAIPFRHLIRGVVETSKRRDYAYAADRSQTSPLGELLRESAWLPFDDGFARPQDLEPKDLPKDFVRNAELALALDMRAGVLRQYSEESGIPPDVLRRMAEDPDRLRRFLAFEAEQEAALQNDGVGTDAEREEEADDEPFDSERFGDALVQAFERPAAPLAVTDLDSMTPSGEVSNPALRRERTSQEISDAQTGEVPEAERFKAVPRRTWEKKNNSTRDALQELYRGGCQICRSSFAKANGSPYFEGLYLVSYTKASWIDRLGNVLSLCATCSAKFQFAEVEADDLLSRIRSWRTRGEVGSGAATIPLRLAGEDVALEFKERHLLDLQEMLASAPSTDQT